MQRRRKTKFFDAKGNLISKKVITYQCLYEKLRKYAFSKQKNDEAEQKNNEVDFCIVSNIIDVLIDRGDACANFSTYSGR